ncbi:MAG: outer membrane protein assembly factor BamE domain-containing protein [Candidatus Anammoxibacter sp.]
MNVKLIKLFLLVLVILLQSSCFFSKARERFTYKQLSKGIINGKIHKGMTRDEVAENFGNPSEKTNPTVYNNVKTQIFIYKHPAGNNSKMYYLYFKDDKLIDWKVF